MMILLTHLYNLTPTWLNPGLLLSEKQATRSIIFFSFQFELSLPNWNCVFDLFTALFKIKFRNTAR